MKIPALILLLTGRIQNFIHFKQSYFREQFSQIDSNQDGLIDIFEFGQFMRAIGLIPSDEEVQVKGCHIINSRKYQNYDLQGTF